MRFYLGTHETVWLGRLDAPLFVSHPRLARTRKLPRARASWALDSGAFSQLAQHGRWTIPEEAYVEAVDRYQDEIGRLEWAAPMDWMCEPFIVAKTGLSVREHQERTVSNYLQLREQGPFIPVLQGWTLADYETCIDLYRDAGVALERERLVGLGSVCRRQHTGEVAAIVQTVHAAGVRAHGFGVKTAGLRRYGPLLVSADSMAWSYGARRDPPLPGCRHRSCQNCPRYAMRWRESVLSNLAQEKATRP